MDAKKAEKVIEVLTEKITELENELWLARYHEEQAEKKKGKAEPETRPASIPEYVEKRGRR